MPVAFWTFLVWLYTCMCCSFSLQKLVVHVLETMHGDIFKLMLHPFTSSCWQKWLLQVQYNITCTRTIVHLDWRWTTLFTRVCLDFLWYYLLLLLYWNISWCFAFFPRNTNYFYPWWSGLHSEFGVLHWKGILHSSKSVIYKLNWVLYN